MYSLSRKIIHFITLALAFFITFACFSRNVYAGSSVTVSMTYNGTVYNKTLYDAEADMIRGGTMTEGITHIGDMCDNATLLSGGKETINKQSVINTVVAQILSGSTSIKIDLTKFAVSKNPVSSNSVSQNVLTPNNAGLASVTTAIPGTATTAVTTKPGVSTPVSPTPLKPAVQSPAVVDYFKHSVFIGDSIMMGFRNYAMNAKNSYINSTNFLCAGSYSLRNALLQSSSLHPTYKGKKQPVWESISQMDVNHVFIMFGMNDLAVAGVDKSCQNYIELVGKIKAAKPGVDIHIISMTNVLIGSEGKMLNNANVTELNTKMAAICSQNGWGFCNLAPLLVDQNGGLASVYCSDHYVHQTHKAYSEVWDPFFYNYVGGNTK